MEPPQGADRSKHSPHPLQEQSCLNSPRPGYWKALEDGEFGGCVGTDQQASEETRHSGYKDQGKGMVFAKPSAAWCGWHARREKGLFGTVHHGVPPTGQWDAPLSEICISVENFRTESAWGVEWTHF